MFEFQFQFFNFVQNVMMPLIINQILFILSNRIISQVCFKKSRKDNQVYFFACHKLKDGTNLLTLTQ